MSFLNYSISRIAYLSHLDLWLYPCNLYLVASKACHGPSEGVKLRRISQKTSPWRKCLCLGRGGSNLPGGTARSCSTISDHRQKFFLQKPNQSVSAGKKNTLLLGSRYNTRSLIQQPELKHMQTCYIGVVYGIPHQFSVR